MAPRSKNHLQPCKSEAMYPPLNDCLLLAERGSRLNQFSESFKGHSSNVDNGEMVTGLLILAGIAALVWLLSRLMGGQDRPKTANSPLRLFLSLCKAHKLSWSECWLLWRLARARHLKDAGRLFLERSGSSRLAWQVRSCQAARLNRLRDGLFAVPPQEKKEEERPPLESNDPPARAALARLDISPWSSVPGSPTAT